MAQDQDCGVRPMTATRGSPAAPSASKLALIFVNPARSRYRFTKAACPLVSSARQIAAALVGKQRLEKLTMERSARSQHTPHFGKYGHRLLQILHANAGHRRIKRLIAKREQRVLVEVLQEPPHQARIGFQFDPIHAVTDNLGIFTIIRQMADPVRHQIQQTAANGK
jgi:hypothetical protein